MAWDSKLEASERARNAGSKRPPLRQVSGEAEGLLLQVMLLEECCALATKHLDDNASGEVSRMFFLKTRKICPENVWPAG